MGPVHIALPSDIARGEDRPSARTTRIAKGPPPIGPASADAIERVASAIAAARRPIVILGLDLDPRADVAAVRAFVERMDAPTFVTPKAKGLLPEDHPLFGGVCAGWPGDPVVPGPVRARRPASASGSDRRVRQAVASHDAAGVGRARCR
jgi:acetolactate synthase-1/2/3 large subunit